jgi:hypothetical protein
LSRCASHATYATQDFLFIDINQVSNGGIVPISKEQYIQLNSRPKRISKVLILGIIAIIVCVSSHKRVKSLGVHRFLSRSGCLLGRR